MSQDQTLEAAAEAFVANYETINLKPPHRPDVLKYCFLAGWAAAEERALERKVTAVAALAAFAEADTPRYWNNILKERDEAMAEVERLKAALTKLKDALQFVEKHIDSMSNYSIISGAQYVIKKALEGE